MNQMVFGPGLLSADGRDLTLEANLHLFQWPGELLYGDRAGYASDEPRTVKQMGLKDWERNRRSAIGATAPFPERKGVHERRDRPPAPDVSARKLRQIISMDEREPPEPSPWNPNFARPNLGAAFDARATRNEWMSIQQDVPNSILSRLKIRSLQADYPRTDTANPPQSFAGAQWLLDLISVTVLDTALIPPVLLDVVGPYWAGRALSQYLIPNAEQGSIRRIVQNIADSTLQQTEAKIQDKLSQLEREIGMWAAIGRLPVTHPDGNFDHVLSTANAVTAIAGISQLCRLAGLLQDFESSARLAIAGVLQEF